MNSFDVSIFLEMASAGAKFPIGTDLILSECADPEAVKLDGRQLGQVVEASARRWNTPLAFPLMDLAVEKEWLLTGLGIPAGEIPTWHFESAVPDHLPCSEPTARLRATVEAIRYIKEHTDLCPCGMSIGPFSLMTKLVSDPITPVFLAGQGEMDEDVEQVERVLELATETILQTIGLQLDAGARAIVLCEPAANTVYFSPNQLAESTGVFDRYVMRLNAKIRDLLEQRSAALVFHDCGELTDDLVRKFGELRPAMLSFGSSRCLWEDARLVPDDVVLYGNLPSKRFYSDRVISVDQVAAMASELNEKMRVSGHPFILGSECDVLSVIGAEEIIRAKVDAFLRV